MRSAGALAFFLLIVTTAGAASPDETATRSIERWAAAATSYPDDPDVAWSYALALAEADRGDEALQRLRELAKRWPDRSADVAFETGTILSGRGDYAPALRAFEDAIMLDPMRGEARLYRALTLRELGRYAEAERELQVLGRIAPELEPDTLLLRGLERVRAGDRAGSLDLLSRVVSIDPHSELAAQARSALDALGQAGGAGPRLIAWWNTGGESDSNLTLEGSNVPPSDRADLGLVFGAGLAGSLYRSDRLDLSLSYQYAGSAHHDLKSYDLQSHALSASTAWAAPALGVLRLDTAVLDSNLGGDPYLQAALVRPNLVIPFGESSARLRLYAEAERDNYQDDPPVTSLERDGTSYAAGLEQTLPISFWPGALGVVQASVGRTNTFATPDLLGFEGDFDERRIKVESHLRFPLGSRCDADLGGAWIEDRYVNENLVDALTDAGTGTLSPKRRHDVSLNGSAALGCWPFPDWRIEARWFGSHERSNVDVYNYRRNVFGLYLSREYRWP